MCVCECVYVRIHVCVCVCVCVRVCVNKGKSPLDITSFASGFKIRYLRHVSICSLSVCTRVPFGTCIPHSFHHRLHQVEFACMIISGSMSRIMAVLRGERYCSASSQRSGKMLFTFNCRRANASAFFRYWFEVCYTSQILTSSVIVSNLKCAQTRQKNSFGIRRFYFTFIVPFVFTFSIIICRTFINPTSSMWVLICTMTLNTCYCGDQWGSVDRMDW